MSALGGKADIQLGVINVDAYRVTQAKNWRTVAL
jgi:hypothetical protein